MVNPNLPQSFRRLMVAVDSRPFLAEIAAHEADWFLNTGRQKIGVQRETSSIFLRGAKRTDPAVHINDVQDCMTTPNAARFPAAMAFLSHVARRQRAELQRAITVRLQPQGKVYAHRDDGEYYRRRDRYHLVLQSRTGSVMTAGNEQVVMQQGELWAFDNKAMHTAENRSDEWRIHLIFDLLPAAGGRLLFAAADPTATAETMVA